MITDESAEKAKAISPKVTAALVDALAPLVTRGGILAVSVTALVAIDENEAIPVVTALAITPEAMMVLMNAVKGYAQGGAPIMEQSSFPVAMPVKQ